MGILVCPHWWWSTWQRVGCTGCFRGFGEAPQVVTCGLVVEMDRTVNEEQPTTWRELVGLGLGVSKGFLGEEPRPDRRPWVTDCEVELSCFDQDV